MSDAHAANELKLYIDNDGDLYRAQTTSILKNLATKRARGKYRHDLAVKAFGYLTEAGAKKYAREFGSSNQGWHKMFDAGTRKLTSEALTRDFEAEASLGNYDHLLPKKYQGQKSGGAHARRKVSGVPQAPRKFGRVEILESGGSSYFKPGQFGYVVGETTRGGMYTLDRGDSRAGELTYLVSKRPKGAGGGALWFSAEALRFTGLRGQKERGGAAHARKKSLSWSSGKHGTSSDVYYSAEDPAPELKHGGYRIRRGEGGSHLSYVRWRDEQGGAVPIQWIPLGSYSSLSLAKAAASKHHTETLQGKRPLSGAHAAIRRGAAAPKSRAQLDHEISHALSSYRGRW